MCLCVKDLGFRHSGTSCLAIVFLLPKQPGGESKNWTAVSTYNCRLKYNLTAKFSSELSAIARHNRCNSYQARLESHLVRCLLRAVIACHIILHRKTSNCVPISQTEFAGNDIKPSGI